MDDRFMYQIRPRKPIVNLIPGKGIRKPMSIKLTKEEVKKCIGYGPVYRAFPSIPPIRVTGSNLDSLHVTEEEYLNKDKKEVKPYNSTEKVVEEPKQEVVIPEEPKTEAPTEKKHIEAKVITNEDGVPTQIDYVVEEGPGPQTIKEADPISQKVAELKSQEELLKKMEEMQTKGVVFEGPTEEEEEPEPIPVPLEPGPVIINPEEKEEKPIPVPVEPGPVIIEPEAPVAVGVVEPQDVVEEEEDDEDEEEEVESLAPVSPNGSLQPQQPRKKKKHKH